MSFFTSPLDVTLGIYFIAVSAAVSVLPWKPAWLLTYLFPSSFVCKLRLRRWGGDVGAGVIH